MSQLASTRALYLSMEGAESTFAILHEPTPALRRRRAVLMCPPFGWDDNCSYRSRRDWAHHLASAGFATLRFDLPGSGDSDGSHQDPGRLAAWTEATHSAAGWLREAAEAQRVCAVGIGLGGLLICRALAADAAIDEAVLWAVPARGRTLLRELRAFERLETSTITLDHVPERSRLEEGAVAAGGFVMSTETVRALEAVDADDLSLRQGQLERVLLLGRDGNAVDERLLGWLRGHGADVAVEPGRGYTDMMAVPHEARPPIDVFVQTQAWLEREQPSAQPVAVGGLARPAPSAADERTRLELSIAGMEICETPLTIEQAFGRIFAVLAEPSRGPAADVCVVLLNAGATRRIGQNRMWVDAARRWAARGIPSLRVDLEAIGDADGDANRFTELRGLYTPERVGQVLAVLDALDERNPGTAYVLAGLCSGACWAFHAALRDERVRAACMLNPRALFWDPTSDTARALRFGLRTRSSWSKLLRGKVPAKTLLGLAKDAPAVLRRRALASWRARRGADDELDRALDQLRDGGKRVRFMFSGREPLREELERQGYLRRTDRWPNVSVEELPGDDHILRPLEAQLCAHEALDRALEDELERLGRGRAAGGRERVAPLRSYG